MRLTSRMLPVLAAALAVALSACSDSLQSPVEPAADHPEFERSMIVAEVTGAEELYLSENLEDGTTTPFPDGTILYSVELTGGVAELHELAVLQGDCAINEVINCDVMFDRAHIGATPDGATVYLLNRDHEGGGNPLATYDVATGDITYEGVVTGLPETGNVLVAFSPGGDFFVASESSDMLYQIDLTTMSVIGSGWPVVHAGGPLDLRGADIAFNAEGTLYLWTNKDDVDGPGLYTVEIVAGDAVATEVQLFDFFVTGLAIRGGGTGNLVGSDNGTKGGSDEILEFTQGGALVTTYPYMLGGVPFNHSFGDMTTGFLGDDDEGCTYTQGYWKNHEEAWPLDPDMPFFSATQDGGALSWMDVMGLSPGKDGKDPNVSLNEADIILAHQWIAAALNVANGASIPSDVNDVWNDAYDYFNGTYAGSPTDEELKGWAEVLDEYNNGYVGPGHCDDLEDDD